VNVYPNPKPDRNLNPNPNSILNLFYLSYYLQIRYSTVHFFVLWCLKIPLYIKKS